MIKNIKHLGSCMKVENGSVVTPKGYYACGLHAGLRKNREDLGFIYSEVPATAAAVYTLNLFQAAPLLVTKESLAVEGKIQGVLVNSACANACTGEIGLENAYLCREAVAKKFHLPEHYVAIASTGVIGEQLKMDKMLAGIQFLEPKAITSGATAFNQAILTTDTTVKSTCYETNIDGKVVTIAGSAKGSGMIHPNMATMLAFITTDANIEEEALQLALRQLTNVSFNQITVDGETSTNDMVLVLANGMANNECLTPNHLDWEKFIHTLRRVCEDLAKMIARDGEGATKLIEVHVSGVPTEVEGNILAKKIVGSSLVKTAVFGEDANWGRIIGAMGHSGVKIPIDNIDIYLGDSLVLKGSQPFPFNEEEVASYLTGDTVTIHVHCNGGPSKGTAWGCDLSYDYVRINASYRT